MNGGRDDGQQEVRENPYLGPEAFTREDSRFFFGRTREAYALRFLLMDRRLVLFYAESGAGKSSLINARLAPDLEQEGFEVLPSTRVVSGEADPSLQPDNVFITNLMLNLDESDERPERFAHLRLADFLLDLVKVGKKYLYITAGESGGELETEAAQLPAGVPDASVAAGPAPAPPAGVEGEFLHDVPDAAGAGKEREPAAAAEDGFLAEEQRQIPPRALIIDQFEELFTTHPEAAEARRDFFVQIGEAMEADPFLHVLLAIREDYVAKLTKYAHLVPGELRTRYHMERLTANAALEAIRGPAKQVDLPFAEAEDPSQDVVQALIRNLRRIRTGYDVQEVTGTALSEFVEPVQLQVVCYELWPWLTKRTDEGLGPDGLRSKTGGKEIRWDDLRAICGDQDPEAFLREFVTDALGTFYNKTVDWVLERDEAHELGKEDPAQAVSKRKIRDWFEQELITEAQTRGQVFRGSSFTGRGPNALPNVVVELLEKRHIIRSEIRPAGTWYELVHDQFIQPILKSNSDFRLALAQRSPLFKAAYDWHNAGRPPDQLYADRQLQDALENISDEDRQDSIVNAFLQESEAAQQQRDLEAAEQRAKRQRVFSGILAVLVLVAIVAAAFGFAGQVRATREEAAARAAQETAEAEATRADVEADRAEQQRGTAVAEADRAEAAQATAEAAKAEVQSLSLARFSRQELDPDRAMALALQANREPRAVAATPPAPAQHALVEAVYHLQTVDVLQHGAPVHSVAFNASQQQALSGGASGTLLLWDLQSGEPQRLLGHSEATTNTVWAVEISPDGRHALSGDAAGQMIYWDLDTCTGTKLPDEHEGTVWSVAFNPQDGNQALSGSADNWVFAWDLSAGEVITRLQGHGDWVYGVAFSPDGRQAISGSEDQSVILWDLADGDVVKRFGGVGSGEGHGDWVRAVAFGPDGETALSASRNIILWDLETGDALRRFSTPTEASIYGLAFDPEGETFLSASDELILWDVETGARLQTLNGHRQRVRVVAFGGDRWTALSGALDGDLRLWDLWTGQIVQDFSGYDVPEATLAERSGDPFDSDDIGGQIGRQITIWDEETQQYAEAIVVDFWGTDEAGCPVFGVDVDGEMREWQDCDTAVLALSPDDRYAVAIAGDGALVLWDVPTGRRLRRFEGDETPVTAAAFVSETAILVGGKDGSLALWDVLTSRRLRRFEGDETPVTVAAFVTETVILAGREDGSLTLWDVDTGQQIGSRPGDPVSISGHEGAVLDIQVLNGGQKAVSGAIDGSLLEWKLGTSPVSTTLVAGKNELQTTLESCDDLRIAEVQEALKKRLTSLTVSPDGRLVAYGLGDGPIVLFDRTVEDVCTKPPSVYYAPTRALRDLAFSADGTQLLSLAGYSVRTWNVLEGGKLEQPGRDRDLAWLGSVRAVVPGAAGRRWLIGLADGDLAWWDSENEVEPLRLRGGPPVAFSHDGTLVLSDAEDYSPIAWDVGSGNEEKRLSGTGASQGHTLPLSGIAPGPRAGYSVLTGSYDGTIALWTLDGGGEPHRVWQSGSPVYGLDSSQDGARVASIHGDGILRLWDLAEPAQLEAPLITDTRPFLSVAINPTGDRVLVGGEGGQLLLWSNLASEDSSPQPIGYTDDVGHTASVWGVDLIADKALSGDAAGQLVIWDLQTEEPALPRSLVGSETVIREVGKEVYSVALSPDGQQALSGHPDGVVLWDVVTGEEIAFRTSETNVAHVTFSPSGRQALFSTSDGQVHLWQLHPSADLLVEEPFRYVPQLQCKTWRDQYDLSDPPDGCLETRPTPTLTPSAEPLVVRIGELVQGKDRAAYLDVGTLHEWTYVGRAEEMFAVYVTVARPAFGMPDDERAERGALDPEVQVLASDGSRVNEIGQPPPWRLPDKGTYTIQVSSVDDATGGAYTLGLRPPTIGWGETVKGAIEPGGQEAWTFQGREGQYVRIAMSNYQGGLDTFLELLGPGRETAAFDDDSGFSANSLIDNFRLSSAGTYTIVARGYSDYSSGAYILSLTESRRQPIALDEVVHADTADGTTWAFQGRTGQAVRIAMHEDGSGINPVLVVLDPNGSRIAADDDRGEGRGALIPFFVPRMDGTYTIVPDAYGLSGGYTLSVSEPRAQPITPGEVVRGDTADGTVWTLQGQTGQAVRIAMDEDGSDINPVLAVLDPNGFRIAADDDGGEGLNALIPFFVPRMDGTYTTVPDTYGPSGGYTLAVSEPRAQPITPVDYVTGDTANGTVWTFQGRAGQMVRIIMSEEDPIDMWFSVFGPDGGLLGTGRGRVHILTLMLPADGDYTIVPEATGPSGAYALSLIEMAAQPITLGEVVRADTADDVVWTFQGRAGQAVRIVMNEDGSGINPLFAVLDPNGAMVAEDNDGGEGRNALISYFVPRMDGTYTIVPDVHGPAGAYALSVSELRPQPITPGEVVRGDTADATIWTFQGRAGQAVRIAMDEDGSKIDPVFAVLDPNGAMVAEDNDGGEGLNALIPFFVPQMDGTYTILPGTYGPSGAYALSVSELRPQPITPGEVVRGDTADATIWTFQGRAGHVMRIAMDEDGSDIDPVFAVLDPNGTMVAWDNDRGEGSNALIPFFVPRMDGTYTILPNTYGPSGAYALSVSELRPQPITPVDYVTGDTADGTVWTFQGRADQVVRIVMSEEEPSDMWFSVFGPDGGLLGTGWGRVRILTLMLPADGNYTIVPEASGPSAAYALSLIEMAAQPITLGEVVRADTADDVVWTFQGRAGQAVRIVMNEDGSGINPLFAVLNPNGGMVAEDNDSGEGRNAMISYFVPRVDGTYTIVPDVHGPAGAYALSVSSP